MNRINCKYIFTLIFIIGLCINLFYFCSTFFDYLDALFYDSVYLDGKALDFFAYYQAGYNALHGLNPYIFVEEYIVVPYSYPYIYFHLVF
jgi:hypothetical protein